MFVWPLHVTTGVFVGVVVREVIFGYLGVEPAADVALILVSKGETVIFAVAGNKHLPGVAGCDERDSALSDSARI